VFAVDTNILVYAADEDSEFHSPCYELLEEWRAQASAWYVTWGIVYEFLRVTTHPRVFRKP
jgi:predicted nucleic acid-binding protein